MKAWTLVTGGAKRLGAELCVGLAKERLPILLHYKTSAEEARHVVEECRTYGVEAHSIQGDFSSLEGTHAFIQNCLEKYPSIKNLINNVGNYLVKSAADTSPEEWNALFQTNLHAPFALSTAFIPSLIQHQGSIINIGMVGVNHMAADTYCTAYRMAKMALNMLTKSLAKELAPQNVRVNMVSPGFLENSVDLPKNVTRLPMHRTASLNEVVRVVSFLLQDDSSYITGQNIEVGGGVLL